MPKYKNFLSKQEHRYQLRQAKIYLANAKTASSKVDFFSNAQALLSWMHPPKISAIKYKRILMFTTLLCVFASGVGLVGARENVFAGGYGGNLRIGKITYDGLPTHYPKLTIQRDADQQICYMEDNDFILFDAKNNYQPVSFPCHKTSSAHNSIYWNGNLLAANDAPSQANDVFFHTVMVREMYAKWFGLKVLLPSKNKNKLHIAINAPFSDAMFNLQERHILFGDGVATNLIAYPYTTLDIVAHEITHSFVANTSCLSPSSQANAVDEALSDMAGELAKLYVYHKHDWLHDADNARFGNYGVRFFADPTRECQFTAPCSIGHMRDYKNKMDAHFASGIFRKAFFVLANAEGWDLRRAFAAMMHANLHYWQQYSTFMQAACGVMRASQDLSYRVSGVVYAMQQVGLDVTTCATKLIPRASARSQGFFKAVKNYDRKNIPSYIPNHFSPRR